MECRGRNDNRSVQSHVGSYLSYLTELLQAVDAEKIAGFIEGLQQAREGGNTIFIAGNGGSAATASHLANDLAMVSIKCGGVPFKAVSLSDNVALISAIANDISYKSVFTEQLKVNFRPGDILIVISASGNSPNVVEAVDWVRENGGRTYAWLGFDGGALLDKCDLVLLAATPKGKYGPVEDMHMIYNHMVAEWFQGKE